MGVKELKAEGFSQQADEAETIHRCLHEPEYVPADLRINPGSYVLFLSLDDRFNLHQCSQIQDCGATLRLGRGILVIRYWGGGHKTLSVFS